MIRHRDKWVALVGLPLDVGAGTYTLRIRRRRGALATAHRQGKQFPTQRLRIADDRMVTPPPELEARIVAEQQRIAEWKRHYSIEREPDTRFELPAAGPRSARFGVKRVLNGEPRFPHGGAGCGGRRWAPLRAPAAGTVLAVADLYFAGKTVVIDHGRGVLTLYAHLSHRRRRGQSLARGKRSVPAASVGASPAPPALGGDARRRLGRSRAVSSAALIDARMRAIAIACAYGDSFMRSHILALTLLTLSTGTLAATVACPDMKSAVRAGVCPTEEELLFTFNGYCSDNARLYRKGHGGLQRPGLPEDEERRALGKSRRGIQGYVSCEMPESQLKALKPTAIAANKEMTGGRAPSAASIA